MENKCNVCDERYTRLNEKIDDNKGRINNHSARIDKLEQSFSAMDARLENLIKQLESLTNVLRLISFSLFGTVVAYIIQNFIFK